MSSAVMTKLKKIIKSYEDTEMRRALWDTEIAKKEAYEDCLRIARNAYQKEYRREQKANRAESEVDNEIYA